MNDPWLERLEVLKKNKAERMQQQQRVQCQDPNGNVVVLLQTIAMQNLQLQQMIMQKNLFESLGHERFTQRRIGGVRDEKSTEDVSPYKQDRYNYLPNSLMRPKKVGENRFGGSTGTKRIIDARPVAPVARKMTRSEYVQRKWRIAISAMIFYTSISKKWKVLKQVKKTLGFVAAAIEDLDIKLYPFFKPIRETISELSAEGADFLIKEGLGYLFTKRPTKIQTQKFAIAITAVVDLVSKVTFLGSSKSKELVNRIITAENLPKSFYWDSEEYPALTINQKSSALVYFILMKCIMTRMIFRAGLEYTDLEERNSRALAYILYRMTRSIGRESNPFPMEPQFKKIILGFTNSQDEANSWNDVACKTLFKNFAAEMSVGITKLNDWAVEEIIGLSRTSETVIIPPTEPATLPLAEQIQNALVPVESPSSPAPPTLAELMQLSTINKLPTSPQQQPEIKPKIASSKPTINIPLQEITPTADLKSSATATLSKTILSPRKTSLTRGNLKASAQDLKRSVASVRKQSLTSPKLGLGSAVTEPENVMQVPEPTNSVPVSDAIQPDLNTSPLVAETPDQPSI